MPRSLIKVIAPLALVLLLGACGSDDDGDDAGTTTTVAAEDLAETTTTTAADDDSTDDESSPYGDLEAMCTSLPEFADGASPQSAVAMFERIAETVPPRLEADAVVVRDIYRSLADEIAAAADAAEVRALVGPAGVGNEASFIAITEALGVCAGSFDTTGRAVGEP